MHPNSDREVVVVTQASPRAYVEFATDASIAGNGYGYLSIDHALATQWQNMMARCYDQTHVSYNLYGGAGVFVVLEWHDYKKYVESVKLLPGWEAKLQDWQQYQLDKDYYKAEYYSPDTCVWIHKHDNNIYKESVKPIQATNAYGHTKVHLSASSAARAACTSPQRIFKWLGRGVIRSKRPEMESLLGWEFALADPSKIYRYKL